jgi:hypothetical protein
MCVCVWGGGEHGNNRANQRQHTRCPQGADHHGHDLSEEKLDQRQRKQRTAAATGECGGGGGLQRLRGGKEG